MSPATWDQLLVPESIGRTYNGNKNTHVLLFTGSETGKISRSLMKNSREGSWLDLTVHADHVAQLVVLVRRPAALELGDLARPRAPTRAPALVAKGRGEGPAGRGLGVDRGVVDCGLVGRLGEPGQIVRKI